MYSVSMSHTHCLYVILRRLRGCVCLQQTLYSPAPHAFENYGSSLALDSGLLVVGAPGHDITLQGETEPMADVGAAYVYSCAESDQFNPGGCQLISGGMLFPMVCRTCWLTLSSNTCRKPCNEFMIFRWVDVPGGNGAEQCILWILGSSQG